jgi:hypothetical protein
MLYFKNGQAGQTLITLTLVALMSVAQNSRHQKIVQLDDVSIKLPTDVKKRIFSSNDVTF